MGHFAIHDQAVEKLKIVFKEFKEAKSDAFRLRKEFIDKYTTTRAKDCNVSPEVMKKMFQRDTITCIDTRVTTIIDTQNEIVEAAADSNFRF